MNLVTLSKDQFELLSRVFSQMVFFYDHRAKFQKYHYIKKTTYMLVTECLFWIYNNEIRPKIVLTNKDFSGERSIMTTYTSSLDNFQ